MFRMHLPSQSMFDCKDTSSRGDSEASSLPQCQTPDSLRERKPRRVRFAGSKHHACAGLMLAWRPAVHPAGCLKEVLHLLSFKALCTLPSAAVGYVTHAHLHILQLSTISCLQVRLQSCAQSSLQSTKARGRTL